ncbi:DUF2461 domain-containing protein [Arthrobacter antibioticus]|uniref:DUF2461 domain-containing protein n=1 Tax=Arthrobacter sp. H35-MC1 TaxID=3046203 RepID=UPI0024B8C3C3|nr:DUF2461 domain-containing protein [Arthrobacter sp. H35-MC1]MDJ0316943.1 DUF2461 domain-containing protein [Arthrobacter sp. H35-MC1]
MDTFTGIPEAALDFYGDLQQNNNRQWWASHKATYDEVVVAPLAALLRELEPRFGSGKIFRPYKDMRFSANAEPYKTTQGLFISHYEGVGFYLQLGAGGLEVGGGYHSFAPAQLSRYRSAVEASVSGKLLAKLTADLVAAGLQIEGQTLATVPRGFPKDHPRQELLKHKTLSASVALGTPEWLESVAAKEHISALWDQLRPLIDWIIRFAAP